MSVNKIEIKRFTVFNDVTINASSGVNVIIGENGTGKTHLLKLIYADRFMRGHFNKGQDELGDPRNSTKRILSYLFGLDVNEGYIHHFIGDVNKNSFEKYNMKDYTLDTENSSMFEVSVDVSKFHESIFIPAKEMLSMSKLRDISNKYMFALNLDSSLINIIVNAFALVPDEPPILSKCIAPRLENIIQGTVFTKDDPKGGTSFWVKKHNGDEIPFSMESEGYRKLGLLWRLIMNESITKDSVLLWDEPEANINPNLVRPIVEILLELARNGVQIFLATHDYFFAKYVEVLADEKDSVAFHGLFKTEQGVQCETTDKFSLLTHNAIIKEKIKLYEEETAKVMGHEFY